MRFAQGKNFSIELDEGIATLSVWRTPDVSFEEGARLAEMILAHVRELARAGDGASDSATDGAGAAGSEALGFEANGGGDGASSSIVAGSAALGFVMDLREAPLLTGKRTRATLREIVATCEAAHKRIGVLLAPGVQRATLQDLLAEVGPTAAGFFTDTDDARVWAEGRTDDA